MYFSYRRPRILFCTLFTLFGHLNPFLFRSENVSGIDGKEESELDATHNFLFIDRSNLARHVSGNNFAHLRELLTVQYSLWYSTFCWPCIMQWFFVIVQLDTQILFNVFIYSSLHVSSMSCSSSRETNCINTASGNCHCVLLAVSCAHDTATNTEWQLPEALIDTICFSWWWAWHTRNM